MTMTTMTFPAAGALARLTHISGTVALRVVNFLRAVKARHEMDRLVGFDDRMLADIGLTRGDLRDAVAEPLWRDPTAILVARSRERRKARRLQVTSADGSGRSAVDCPGLGQRRRAPVRALLLSRNTAAPPSAVSPGVSLPLVNPRDSARWPSRRALSFARLTRPARASG